MEDSLTIKVTYGGVSRRFREHVDANRNLAVAMIGLRARIFEHFDIPPYTNVSITYVDDGSDVMNLIDDEDLLEAMAQGLKCLKITVVNNERIEQVAKLCLNELGQVHPLQRTYPKEKMKMEHLGGDEPLKDINVTSSLT